MIITLKGASFADSNIGTLSTWTISRVLGDGATYNGVTYVDKNAALNATVTIAEGYELGSAGVSVTMGGAAQSGVATTSSDGKTITISIASVTGNVVIKVPTKSAAGGEEEEPDTPDEPSTSTLIWYSNQIEQPKLTTVIDLSSAPYGYTDELCSSYYNKPVNRIRLKVATAGTISFGVCSADRKTIVSTYTIPVTVGADEYVLSETFTLTEGQGIWWQKSNDTGKSYCSVEANDKLGTFYSRVGTSSPLAPHNSKYSLGFDLGYYG